MILIGQGILRENLAATRFYCGEVLLSDIINLLDEGIEKGLFKELDSND